MRVRSLPLEPLWKVNPVGCRVRFRKPCGRDERLGFESSAFRHFGALDFREVPGLSSRRDGFDSHARRHSGSGSGTRRASKTCRRGFDSFLARQIGAPRAGLVPPPDCYSGLRRKLMWVRLPGAPPFLPVSYSGITSHS